MDGRAEAAEKTAENGRNKEFYNQDTSRGTEETRSRRERQARGDQDRSARTAAEMGGTL